jgi:hypothetical protein
VQVPVLYNPQQMTSFCMNYKCVVLWRAKCRREREGATQTDTTTCPTFCTSDYSSTLTSHRPVAAQTTANVHQIDDTAPPQTHICLPKYHKTTIHHLWPAFSMVKNFQTKTDNEFFFTIWGSFSSPNIQSPKPGISREPERNLKKLIEGGSFLFLYHLSKIPQNFSSQKPFMSPTTIWPNP